jgi:hypothetical protein
MLHILTPHTFIPSYSSPHLVFEIFALYNDNYKIKNKQYTTPHALEMKILF